MSLKSSTFTVQPGNPSAAESKERLLNRHQAAIERVLENVKDFKENRKRILNEISDKDLRDSAER